MTDEVNARAAAKPSSHDAQSNQETRSSPGHQANAPGRPYMDPVREFIHQTTQEKSGMAIGVVLGSLEGLRLSANVVGSFAEEVLLRSQRIEGDALQGARQRLSRYILGGLVKAVDESLRIPSQTVNKFYESYRRVNHSRSNDS